MKTRLMNGIKAVVQGAVVVALGLAALVGASLAALQQVPAELVGERPAPARAEVLRDLLAQDCGACHGLRLTGGLGPPLIPEALTGKPPELLAYTILNGRPGTAMPPWAAFLSEPEALWLARELKGGRP